MDFAELFSNPSMMHAAAVHMPIAAAVFGFIFIILSAIFQRSTAIRLATVLIFVILVASAWVGIETGEDARDLVPNTISTAVSDQISAHAHSAERVLYGGIATLAFVLISLIPVNFFRIGGLLCAAVGAFVVNILVAQTGHMGGALVYNEGVGTPLIHQKATPVAVVEPTEEVSEGTAEETPMVEVVVVEPEPDPSADWIPIREIDMEEAKLVSYTRDVWPLLDDQCVVCHESPDADGDYEVTSVEKMLLSGKKGGPGVVPGKPDESSIITYIRGKVNPRMPEDEDPLSEDDLHMLRMWIAAGAIDDGAIADAGVPAEPVMTEETPAPEAAPEVAPVEEEMTEEAPAVEAPADAPVSEATPDLAPVVEEMKEESPAVEVPADAPVPEVVPDAAPAEEEMKDAAPAVEAPVDAPAPETVPEAAPATEDAPVAAEAPEAPVEAAPVEESAPAEEAAPALANQA